jgi:hypothetical protein
MRQRLTGGLACAALAAGVLLAACGPAMEESGDSSASMIPRLEGTEAPAIHGVWQTFRETDYNLEGQAAAPAVVLHEGVPNGGPVPNGPVLALGALGGVPPSLGVVVGGTIPYTPEALAVRDDNRAHALVRDPVVKCLMPGVPRATYLGFPLQITQGTDKIMIAYGFSNAGRTIHLDEVDAPGIDSWMGHSVGRWEGDTLVVDTTNFSKEGGFQGATEQMQLVERFTRVDDDLLMYHATIQDEATFTQPWTIEMTWRRGDNKQNLIFESACHEGNYALTSILAGARVLERAR